MVIAAPQGLDCLVLTDHPHSLLGEGDFLSIWVRHFPCRGQHTTPSSPFSGGDPSPQSLITLSQFPPFPLSPQELVIPPPTLADLCMAPAPDHMLCMPAVNGAHRRARRDVPCPAARPSLAHHSSPLQVLIVLPSLADLCTTLLLTPSVHR